MKGSEFAAALADSIEERELQIVEAVQRGHAFVEWVPLDVSDGETIASVYVAADSIAIGTADDFFRVSLTATTTQIVADLLDAMLPTSKICDLAHERSVVRLEPATRAPSARMMSTEWMREQHAKIEARRAGRKGLVSSVGKDWVLTPRLVGREDRSANYGGHTTGGQLRGPSPRRARVLQSIGLAHNRWHVDYSQTPRLVRRGCLVDYYERNIGDLLRDPVLHKLVSDEGVVLIDRIPTTGPTTKRVVPSAVVPSPRTEQELATDAIDRLTPTLRQGAKGPAVVDVQQIVGAKVDGDYGPATKARVAAWQAQRGLTADGVFGPRSWAVARAEEAQRPAPPIAPPSPEKFIAAKHFTPTAGRQIDLVVLHTAEVAENVTSAEAVARYFANPIDAKGNAVIASAHFCVDVDSVVACVHEKDVAFAAPDCNRNGIQIELSGYARQSAEDWADEYSQTMLRRAARLVARVCQTYSIPIKFVDADGLHASWRGITTHASATKAFPVSKTGKKRTHWDPGPSFPMEAFIALVREFADG